MSNSHPEEGSTFPLILCSVIALFGVLLYVQSVKFGFVYDDYLQIIHNTQVTEPSRSLLGLLSEPTPPGNLYRPLATLSYLLTERGFGLSPFAFHLTNILIYGMVCFCVLPFIWVVTRSQHAAVIGATLFVVLPIHTEAVANVIGRAEMLSTLFILLAFFASRRAACADRGFSITFFSLFGGMFYLAAILSKESSFPMIFPVILGCWLALDKKLPVTLRAIRIFTPFSVLFVCAAVGLWLRAMALGSNFIIAPDGTTWVENPLFNEPFLARILPSLALLGRYLSLTFFPLGLSADYSSTPTYFYQWLASSGGVSSIGVLLLTAYILWRVKGTASMFLALWFLAGFSLTINLITPIGTIMGDRLAFAPSVAACGLFGLLINWALQRLRPLTILGTTAYLMLLAFLTVKRTPVWFSNETLFAQTVIDAPYSPKAWYNLGVERVLKDPTSKEGEEYFRRSLELFPEYLLPTKAMADIMLARKDYGRLEYWYRAVLALSPADTTVQENLLKLMQSKVS